MSEYKPHKNGKRVSMSEYQEHCKRMTLFNQMLEEHDWFYSFSDDHGVYMKGKYEVDRIKNAIKSIGLDAKRLFDAKVLCVFGPHSGFEYPPEKSDDEYEDRVQRFFKTDDE